MNNSDKQFITRKVNLLCKKHKHDMKINNLMGFTAVKKKMRVLFSLKDPYYPCFITPNGDYTIIDTVGTLEYFLFTNYEEHIIRIFSSDDYEADGGERIKTQRSMSFSARLSHYKSCAEKAPIKVNPIILSEISFAPESPQPSAFDSYCFSEAEPNSSSSSPILESSSTLPRVSYDHLDFDADDADDSFPVSQPSLSSAPLTSKNNSNTVKQAKVSVEKTKDFTNFSRKEDNKAVSFSKLKASPTKPFSTEFTEKNKSDQKTQSKKSEFETPPCPNTPKDTKIDQIRKLCLEFDEVLRLNSTSAILEILVDQQLNGVDVNLDILKIGLQRRLLSLPPVITDGSEYLGGMTVHNSQKPACKSNSGYSATLSQTSVDPVSSESRELVPFADSSAWEVLPSAFQSFATESSSGFTGAGFSDMGSLI